ncbi:MAG TPA: pirin family protein [Rhodanobacteraceae bacterium]|nr:pirin family protein [Rhodanobacteraceae bacterium]
MNTVIRERARGKTRDLGDGFTVSRVLPAAHQHAVGPFVFMDHLGPVVVPAGQAFDVRPHPHIGLATVTYLWEGRIEHRDGLGNVQTIEPGAVNWMTAGSGIVHSERTPAENRGKPQPMHGLQLWVALPLDKERGGPAFEHTEASALPALEFDGVHGRVVAGNAYGKRSPVSISSELFYVDAQVPQGKPLRLPDDHAQRAAYVVEGAMHAGEETLIPGELVSFEPGVDVSLVADVDSHVVLLGGAPLDAPRYIWWNFVASSEALLEDARQAWLSQRYPMVAGDPEFIPLPEHRRAAIKLTAG